MGFWLTPSLRGRTAVHELGRKREGERETGSGGGGRLVVGVREQRGGGGVLFGGGALLLVLRLPPLAGGERGICVASPKRAGGGVRGGFFCRAPPPGRRFPPLSLPPAGGVVLGGGDLFCFCGASSFWRRPQERCQRPGRAQQSDYRSLWGPYWGGKRRRGEPLLERTAGRGGGPPARRPLHPWADKVRPSPLLGSQNRVHKSDSL